MADFFKIEQVSKLPRGDVTALKLSELSVLEKPITTFLQKVTQSATQNLDRADANASASLRQSMIILPVEAYGAVYEMALSMNDYWKFVDLGVKGRFSGAKAPNSPFKYTNKMPPRASIEQWITEKGINPGGRRGQRMQPRADLARSIQRSIYLYGTKQTSFLTNALTDDLISAMTNEVAEALGKTISISIVLPK